MSQTSFWSMSTSAGPEQSTTESDFKEGLCGCYHPAQSHTKTVKRKTRYLIYALN